MNTLLDIQRTPKNVSDCTKAQTSALHGPRPILISGVYRSGTTFLTAVINNHPNIAAASSTVKYLRFCLPHFDLTQPNALDDLLAETSARVLTRWGLELNILEIKETLENNPVSHAAVYDAIMNSLLVNTKSGAKRWAEKLALQFPGHIKTDFEEGIRQTINWLEPLVKKGKL